MTTFPSTTIPTLRAARRVAQADLANAVGVSAATMSNLELGRRPASPEVVERIAAALDCPLEVVAGGNFVLIAHDGQIEVKAPQA